MAEIAAAARERDLLVHTDAAQSVGKVATDVDALGLDLMTAAGRKLYAPKGIGALFVRPGTRLDAVIHGGGHEGGLRAGTENVPYIVGLGAAAELAAQRLQNGAHSEIRALRDRLHAALAHRVPGLMLNGHPERRLPNTLNVSFPSRDGEPAGASAVHRGRHRVGLPLRAHRALYRSDSHGNRRATSARRGAPEPGLRKHRRGDRRGGRRTHRPWMS